jgi:ferredoxin-fold anticodon binding domain-containing protein
MNDIVIAEVEIKDVNDNVVATFSKPLKQEIKPDTIIFNEMGAQKVVRLKITATTSQMISGTDDVKLALGIQET